MRKLRQVFIVLPGYFWKKMYQTKLLMFNIFWHTVKVRIPNTQFQPILKKGIKEKLGVPGNDIYMEIWDNHANQQSW